MTAGPVHLVVAREANVATSRCGVKVKVKPKDRLADAGMTGWQSQVTCAGCLTRLGAW